MTTYSIRYKVKGLDGDQLAVDWSWLTPNRWTSSVKEAYESRWYPSETLDDKAYLALLEHFGLSDWSDKYDIEMVSSMNPKQLAIERRKKEAEFNLEEKKIVSDTLGYHIEAINYDNQ